MQEDTSRYPQQPCKSLLAHHNYSCNCPKTKVVISWYIIIATSHGNQQTDQAECMVRHYIKNVIFMIINYNLMLVRSDGACSGLTIFCSNVVDHVVRLRGQPGVYLIRCGYSFKRMFLCSLLQQQTEVSFESWTYL